MASFTSANDPVGGRVDLDDSQRGAVDAALAAVRGDGTRPGPGSVLSVVGAAGSGKTSTLAELHRRLIAGEAGPLADTRILTLAADRHSASRLRERLAANYAAAYTAVPARTAPSFAFEVLRAAAAARDAPPPVLTTGAEIEQTIAELLAELQERGELGEWPPDLPPEVFGLAGFRAELRDLLTRCIEYGVAPQELHALGERLGRREWVASAGFFREYLQVRQLLSPDGYDSAELLRAAALALADDDALPDELSGIRVVLLDDAQEATNAVLSLVVPLWRRGATVVTFGDPDAATNAFRGGIPEAAARFGQLMGGDGQRVLTLEHVYRGGGTLALARSKVAQRIGVSGWASHRTAVDAAAQRQGDERVDVVLASSNPQQALAIANLLRERHLAHGVPWERMAVVSRSGGTLPALARSLAVYGVPVTQAFSGGPLAHQEASRQLLLAAGIAYGAVALDEGAAIDLLTGFLGGLTAIDLRRLKRALRAREVLDGGERSVRELLPASLAGGFDFDDLPRGAAWKAERLARLLEQARAQAVGGTVDQVLWSLWHGSGAADAWRKAALGDGAPARDANDRLDAVMALFTAAKRFVERSPEAPGSEFVVRHLEQRVIEDTLAARAAAPSVELHTPTSMLGRSYDTVIIVGLQDGGWPNLKPRSSLLGAEQLAELRRTGTITTDASLVRQATLQDEYRLLYRALGSADRRVVLSAIVNEDEDVSPFLSLFDDGDLARVVEADPTPRSLRGETARLRAEAERLPQGDPQRTRAVRLLARLARAGVEQAEPEHWHGLQSISSDTGLFSAFDDGRRVRVTPSSFGTFEESSLEWVLGRLGAERPSSSLGIGTLVHWVAERGATLDDPSPAALASLADRWWEDLGLEGWEGELLHERVHDMLVRLSTYLRQARREGRETLGLEVDFKAELEDADLVGKIDRIERDREGNIIIVDYKTGSHTPTSAELPTHPQLSLYQYAVSLGAVEGLEPTTVGRAQLIFVRATNASGKPSEKTQEGFGPEQLADVAERVRRAADGMSGVVFTFDLNGTPRAASIHIVGEVTE